MDGAPSIFLAGATGFIGSSLLPALREKNYRVRCLVRARAKAGICKSGPETIEAAIGDITERNTLKGALDGIRTVVHLVGIIEERGRQTFEKVHVEGTANLVDEAKKAGAAHFFYQSALGADKGSWAKYLKTKAEAEDIVKASGIPYTIFRPSLVVGRGDGFTEKLISVIKSPSPFIPVPGRGEAKFQPIYIGDWIKCFLSAIGSPDALGKTYEFGGPEYLTYNEIVKIVSSAMGVGKHVVHIPKGIAGFGVRLLEKTSFRPATSEQLRLLEKDNVCGKESVRKQFGFDPMPFGEAVRLFISPV